MLYFFSTWELVSEQWSIRHNSVRTGKCAVVVSFCACSAPCGLKLCRTSPPGFLAKCHTRRL